MKDADVKIMLDRIERCFDTIEATKARYGTWTPAQELGLYEVAIDGARKTIESYRKNYKLTSDTVDDFDGHPLKLI